MNAADFPARDGLRYGALGFALAFVIYYALSARKVAAEQ